jgi:hypothetical protein
VSRPRHLGEFLTGDEATPLAQRDQLGDPVTITRNGEGLSVLDRIHDLSGPIA